MVGRFARADEIVPLVMSLVLIGADVLVSDRTGCYVYPRIRTLGWSFDSKGN
jgi:hypothetical protein